MTRLAVLLALAALLVAPAAKSLSLRGDVAPRHRAWIAAAKAPLPVGTVRLERRRDGCYGWAMACWDGNALAMPTRLPYAQEKALLFHELGHVFDERHLSTRERRQFGRAAGRLPDDTPLDEAFAEQYAACALGVSRAAIPPEQSFYDYDAGSVAEQAICSALRGWAR